MSDTTLMPTPDATTGVDPVCGMSVDRATARARGLISDHSGVEYVFCGRGCKLDFDEDPGRFLEPDYRPTM